MTIKDRNTMTKEKAIDLLDCLIGMVEDNQENDYDTAFKMGIEALRQEPCEDAVSRKYILDKIYSEDDMDAIENSNLFAVHYANLVKNAPSVTSTFDKIPTTNAIPIPQGETNGDMIMAMFNCMVIGVSKGKVYVEGIFFPFDEEWWNAPYQRESEEIQ